jgi:predicted Co/Zn/Cd cation transporter (cation efflux family)
MNIHLKISSTIVYVLASFWLYNAILKMVSAKNDIEVLIGVLLLIAHLYITAVLAVKLIKPKTPSKNEKSPV